MPTAEREQVHAGRAMPPASYREARSRMRWTDFGPWPATAPIA
jgi:hypothetical protein